MVLKRESTFTLRARLGGLALSASRDPKEYTVAARAAFSEKFRVQVDPDGLLPEPERDRRAEAARRLHFAKLAFRSAAARRRSGRKTAALSPAPQAAIKEVSDSVSPTARPRS